MLMSLNLYSELHCVKKGVQLLRDIDIKSIQYDSMGYVCFPHFVRLDKVNGQVLMESALPFYRSEVRTKMQLNRLLIALDTIHMIKLWKCQTSEKLA